MIDIIHKKVVLRAPGFLGDEVVFTGVVREIKRATGWTLRINTTREALWHYNDSVEGFGSNGNEDLIIEEDYCPPYHQMNQVPVHYLEQYIRSMREVLGLTATYRVSKFSGQIVLSGKEMRSRLLGLPSRYWLIVAGWKPGVPTKAWPTECYQEVVDKLRGRIQFVQAGSRANWHPPLNNVINLVGRTSLRQLIQLIYHAEGVVCPITSIMHLAAAIPANPASGFSIRPCVVIGGGRESPHYINYPMHRVMSTVGQLTCCASSACGKTNFGPGQCPLPTPVMGEVVPKCMTLIRPSDVVSAIEFYYRGQVALPPRLGRVEVLLNRIHLLEQTEGCTPKKGLIVGDIRGRVSSQLLRGNGQMEITCVNSLGFNSVPSVAQWSQKRSMIEAYAHTRQETEFARPRCNMIMPSEHKGIHGLASGFDFVFVEAQNDTALSSDMLEQLYGKISPGGFLMGTCRNNDLVYGVVGKFANEKGFTIVPEKDNCWLIHRHVR